MKKTIKLNETEITLKSSAATNILYKRAFKEDILIKLTAYTKNLKELKDIQAKFAELKEDKTKTQEEILEGINALMNSEAFISTQDFQNNTLPRLTYIMFLEANETQDTIFSKLNDESFIFWLMSINQDDLLAMTSEVIGIWQSGARTTSTLKN